MRRGDLRGARTMPHPTAIVIVALVVLVLVALSVGDYVMSPLQVLRALVTDAGFDSTVVRSWRLPRVLVAVAFGAALGVAGAIFQSITRNPLGSPDIIGFSTGSYTGVLVLALLVPGSGVGAASGALVGGLATAVLVYLLAYRRGVHGFRLIVVGVGVTAMLHALNTWLLLRASTEEAMGASIWGAGSLSLVEWPQAVPALIGIAVVLPVVAMLANGMRQLELGDDAAASHGLRVEPARLALLLVGVALTAIVTATAGPIAFVALTAPQIAARLGRSSGLPLVRSALVGALLLLGADMVAQHVLPQQLPVGIVTTVVGGGYLVWLLVREARRGW